MSTDRFGLNFQVLGIPQTKGSGKAIISRSTKRPIYIPANPKARAYENDVAQECHLRMGSRMPHEGPVEVTVIFFMPRPKSAAKSVVEPISRRGDIDKILRATLDGLVKGGAMVDDSQVIHVAARKAFAGGVHDPLGPAGLPRAVICVEECAEIRRVG